ncbi:uncharacterized protein JCM15063_003684 [Sporobolomyces koalae]|uniref:uncharacterized protein n=1 Tax=Sporobolomyces koalae TaxID=500713 RepID=UPI003179727C
MSQDSWARQGPSATDPDRCAAAHVRPHSISPRPDLGGAAHAAAIAPVSLADYTSPASPSILLSPSTPEFPAVELPGDSADGDLACQDPEQPPLGFHSENGNGQMDNKLRHSLMLLDSRLAELENLGSSAKPPDKATLPVVRHRVSMEIPLPQADGVDEEDCGPVNVSHEDGLEIRRRTQQLIHPRPAPFLDKFMLARTCSSLNHGDREMSTRSLVSVASGVSTHGSSEDAFDIVDFPSIDQLDLDPQYGLGLAAATRLPASPPAQSSGSLAFPAPPPNIPRVPLESVSTTDSQEHSMREDEMFEQLHSLGQTSGVQGLGLFSEGYASRTPSHVACSDTDGDSRSLCSNFSSLGDSTLASSYAPTFENVQSTMSSKIEHSTPVPVLPLYARRAANGSVNVPAPPPIVTSHVESNVGLHTTLGSPFSLQHEMSPSPGSLSPYSFVESPSQSAPSCPSSPHLPCSPSRQDIGFAELHQASLGLLGAFDDGGIPMWQIQPEDEYSRTRSATTTDKQQKTKHDLLPAGGSHNRSPATKQPVPSKPSRAFSTPSGFPASSPSEFSPLGALRRLSSFQIVRKRKSDVQLGAKTTRPVLSKPKSEAALSSLFREHLDHPQDNNENILPNDQSRNRLGKISNRSKSSPRLSKLASAYSKLDAPVLAPPSKPSESAASPRAVSSDSEDNVRSRKQPSANPTRKRFSILLPKQFSSPRSTVVPPVPQTPTQPPTEQRVPIQNVLVAFDRVETSTPVKSPQGDVIAGSDPSTAASPPKTNDSTATVTTTCVHTVDSPGQGGPAAATDEDVLPRLAPIGTIESDADIDCPITLTTFLDVVTDISTNSLFTRVQSDSLTSNRSPALVKDSLPPLGDRTNRSHPTSLARLENTKSFPLWSDAEDLVVVPQHIAVFPVRLPAPTMHALAQAGTEADAEAEQDDYGGDSESDEDRPLGVTVPGALTAQKSLRKSISKKAKSRTREDPFEFENVASTMPSTSSSQRHAPPVPVHPQPQSLVRKGQAEPRSSCPPQASEGHDSFLPQTDASIARRANSNGMKRSPSTPLDPMIADSALTIDSPVLTHEPLPRQSSAGPNATRLRSLSKPARLQEAVDDAVAAPSIRGPPLNAPPRSTPPPVPTAVRAPLNRRPSLHPDIASLQSTAMQRQSSSSSAKSSSTSLSSSAHAQAPTTMAQRPSAGGRSRSGTVACAASAALEWRVYLENYGAKHLTVKIRDRTTAGEVVTYARGRGALEHGLESEGGWALWEVWQELGLERPIREYELLNDIVRSFDEKSAGFVLRRTKLWPILSAHARPHACPPKSAQVQLEVKKGKWSKRNLSLRDGTLSHSKSDKGKDSIILCQLSNFAAFFVDPTVPQRLKAPRPHVFAMKSRLTRANFEEVSQFCVFVSVKSQEDLDSWIAAITESGNEQMRQREHAVLATSGKLDLPTSPLLASGSITSGTMSLPVNEPPAQSLADTAQPRSFLTRQGSARPAPAILARTGDQLPSRRPSSSKPLIDLSH